MATSGTTKANIFRSNITPEKTAIPNSGVKFGGWGISLLNASIVIKAKIDITNTSANVNLLEEEHGIAPGQACVFYSKNNNGYKVLGGGLIIQ